jgi:hypothetical protein
MRNPKLHEALKAGSPKPAVPNINCACESCGKLKANGARAFFLAARTGFFVARKWLPERSRLPVARVKFDAHRLSPVVPVGV